MEKEFVDYETAVELMKLGFDEHCFGGYDETDDDKPLWIGYESKVGEHFNRDFYTPAPLKQQVFRWFREKYGLSSYIFFWLWRVGRGYDMPNHSATGSIIKQTNDNTFTSYEEAEEACIYKLIEIVKQLN